MEAEILRIRRQDLGERHPDTIRSIGNYAASLYNLGRLEEAEPLSAEALRLAREVLGERDPDTLGYLGDYGLLLLDLGRPQEAEPIIAEALRLNEELLGERHPATLRGMSDYGSLLVETGRAIEAEPYFADALRLRREVLGNRHPDTITSLNNYAFVLDALDRNEEAMPIYSEAYRLARETLGERHPQTVLPLAGYGLSLHKLGRSEEAEPVMAEALQLTRDVYGEQHPNTLTVLSNYALVLSSLGRIVEAEPLHAEALQLRRDLLGNQHPDLVTSLVNYALLVRDRGRTGEAETLLAEALQLGREVFDDRHPRTLLAMRNYAAVLVETGQPERALPLFRELAATTRSRVVDLSEQGVRGAAQRDRELVGRQTAERFYADGLWDSLGDEGTTPQGLAREAFGALQLATAGSTSRAVAEAAAARFAISQGLQDLVQERQALTRDWTAIEATLVESQVLGTAASSGRQQLAARLSEIEERLARIDQQLQAEAPQYYAILNQQTVTLDELRSVLGEEEAVLFLVPTIYGTQSMAVTGENIRWSRGWMDEGEIADAVARFRSGLEIDGTTGLLPLFDLDLAFSLYANLFADVESLLEGKSRVYVIAEGELSRLPLGTLIASEPPEGADPDDPAVLRSMDWLADRHALVQLPSLQSLIFIRSFGLEDELPEGVGFSGFGAPLLGGEARLRGARSATLAAVDAAGLVNTARGATGMALMNPAALRQLAALPGTQTELEQVRAALGAPADALYLAERMTEPAIRHADLSTTRILHLATHGFTSEESGSAAEPGLVFTPPTEARRENDGYLAASEVVGIDLTAAEWVILSACNTASPSGRPGETGLSGLAQAFFYAGAQSLLVSHWPVFDDIAPVLTVETLRRSQEGEPRAEALQAAMRDIRNNPELDAAHPAVWAPFALVGEGR